MTLQSTIKHFAISGILIALGAFISIQFTGLAWAAPGKPNLIQYNKQSSTTQLEKWPNATSAPIAVTCPVENVGVDYLSDTSRIYSSQCVPSTGAIQYFFVAGADTKKANQLLSIGLAAKETGKSVLVVYDPNDTSGGEIGRKVLQLVLP
ncbi:MAG: hypothetical protein U0350_32450 [Caldilineaceae bacterium]